MPFDIGGQMTPAAFVQAAAAVIGLCFIAVQLWQVLRSLRGATQDRLYAHYMEVCKLMMGQPKLYPYFYEDKPIQTIDPTLKESSQIVCEAFLGLIEHAILQQKNLPKDAWRNCWLPFAKERVSKSEPLRNYFRENEGWYAKELRKTVKQILREHKNLAEECRARSFSPERRSFSARLGQRERETHAMRLWPATPSGRAEPREHKSASRHHR